MSFPSSTITEIPKNERKIIDYTVVYQNSNKDLINEVRSMFKYGWEPIGGISQAIRSSSEYPNFVMQAMVKYEDK